MAEENIQSELMPARMLNEYAYCPRLFYLMHVEGRWQENLFTVQGSVAHKRVDKKEVLLPELEKAGLKIARSITLSSEKLGIIAKLDLLESNGDVAIPIDSKRGRPPDNPYQCWEPERVQLMAQGLLLREHGYQVDQGVLYFVQSKQRVNVELGFDLELRTMELLEEAKIISKFKTRPNPLEDSPKCQGCSLNSICLPEEVIRLKAEKVEKDLDVANPDWTAVKRLYPPKDDATPLYVQEQGAQVCKSGNLLKIWKGYNLLGEVKLKDLSQLVLCGSIQVTAQLLHLLCDSGIPIVHLSRGHWFYGITQGMGLKNAFNKAAQFRKADDHAFCLEVAKAIVMAKGQNQRTLLRRNGKKVDEALFNMKRLIKKVSEVSNLESLRGVEGSIASNYFGSFTSMLKNEEFAFSFNSRNRRPPKDPVNALLSFGYTLLSKDCTLALSAIGLDPYWGFFHTPRHGRPSLALDLMEEFRPLLVDSVVITCINTGAIQLKDFEIGDNGCLLKDKGRKAFISGYENRMDKLVTHPIFNYKCSWRRILRMQAELLGRFLHEEIPKYPGMVTR